MESTYLDHPTHQTTNKATIMIANIPLLYQIRAKLSIAFSTLTSFIKGVYFRYSIAQRRGGSNLQWGLSSLLCNLGNVLPKIAVRTLASKTRSVSKANFSQSLETQGDKRLRCESWENRRGSLYSKYSTSPSQTPAQPNYLRRLFSAFTLFLKTKESLELAITERLSLRKKIEGITNWRNIIETLTSSPTTEVGLGYSL